MRLKKVGKKQLATALGGWLGDTRRPTVTPAKRMSLEQWTLKRRMLGGKPFSLELYPYMKDVYADESQVQVFMKAAQMAVSELAINKALWALDEWGMDILYVLPTDDEGYDFSNGRLGPVIEESDYLQTLFTDVANVQHKRAGEQNMYIRGSQKRSRLKSVPIDFLILDEFDEMVQKNLPVARRRLDASPWKWELDISTPTVPEFGVHLRWLESDQHEWTVQCPSCNHWQIPDWPANINLEVIPAQYWCAKCHTSTESFIPWKGLWVPQNPQGTLRGRCITQLLNPNKTAQHMAQDWKTAENDPSAEQEFWNQGLGKPHVSKGGAIDDDMLLACRDPAYSQMPSTGRRCTMGVDVGKVLHVRVSTRELQRKRAVYVGTVPDFKDLDPLMQRYDVSCCVIDSAPESRLSMEFCQRFAGRAFAADYTIKDKAEMVRWDTDKRMAHINRTVAMDRVMARVQTRALILHAHAQTIPDYFVQMKAPKRILETDKKTGKQVYRYVEGTRADHFAHAELYDEVAFDRAGQAPDLSGMQLNLSAGKRESPWKP